MWMYKQKSGCPPFTGGQSVICERQKMADAMWLG